MMFETDSNVMTQDKLRQAAVDSFTRDLQLNIIINNLRPRRWESLNHRIAYEMSKDARCSACGVTDGDLDFLADMINLRNRMTFRLKKLFGKLEVA